MTVEYRNDKKAVPQLLALNCGDLYTKKDIEVAMLVQGI
jgi:hypothetical protein